MTEKKGGVWLWNVAIERGRQERLKQKGKFAWTLSDVFRKMNPDELARTKSAFGPDAAVDIEVPISQPERLAVLLEEVGEVSKEVCEGLSKPLNRDNLRAELIQVAACAVAWCEALDAGCAPMAGSSDETDD